MAVNTTPSTGGTFSPTAVVTSIEGGSGTATATLTVTAAVPTLPQWMLILLGLLLVASGAHRLRQRYDSRRSSASTRAF